MGSKFWILLLGLAVIAIGTVSGRAIMDTDESEDADNLLSNDVEAPPPNSPVEWLKVTVAPEPHVQHKLGSPLELECEIMGTPPPQVKWIRGPYNANTVSTREINLKTNGRLIEILFCHLFRMRSFPRMSSAKDQEEWVASDLACSWTTFHQWANTVSRAWEESEDKWCIRQPQ